MQGEQKNSQWFIAGTLPSVVITDAEYNIPVWVSSRTDNWVSELEQDADLKTVWNRSR